jgi:hypothetical protein
MRCIVYECIALSSEIQHTCTVAITMEKVSYSIKEIASWGSNVLTRSRYESAGGFGEYAFGDPNSLGRVCWDITNISLADLWFETCTIWIIDATLEKIILDR